MPCYRQPYVSSHQDSAAGTRGKDRALRLATVEDDQGWGWAEGGGEASDLGMPSPFLEEGQEDLPLLPDSEEEDVRGTERRKRRRRRRRREDGALWSGGGGGRGPDVDGNVRGDYTREFFDTAYDLSSESSSSSSSTPSLRALASE
jgi:hypothetical protein